MKKEFFLIIIILIIIIVLEIVTNYISKNSVDKTYKEIVIVNKKLEDANIKKENSVFEKVEKEELDKEIKKLKNTWFKEQDKLSFFFEHDELEKVSKCVIVLEENARNEEYTDALEDGKEFIYWLDHFKEKDSMKLKNIF